MEKKERKCNVLIVYVLKRTFECDTYVFTLCVHIIITIFHCNDLVRFSNAKNSAT